MAENEERRHHCMCSHLGRCNRPNVWSSGALGTGHCSQHNLAHLAGASAHHHATWQAWPSMQGSHANPHAAGSWPLWGALPPQCNTTACVAMALAAGPQASAVAAPPACQQCGTPTHGISCSVANIGNVGPRHHARWAIHCGNVRPLEAPVASSCVFVCETQTHMSYKNTRTQWEHHIFHQPHLRHDAWGPERGGASCMRCICSILGIQRA